MAALLQQRLADPPRYRARAPSPLHAGDPGWALVRQLRQTMARDAERGPDLLQRLRCRGRLQSARFMDRSATYMIRRKNLSRKYVQKTSLVQKFRMQFRDAFPTWSASQSGGLSPNR
jgi:hypothetical protein